MDDTAHEPESQRSTASRGSRRRATGLLYAYDIDALEREPRHVGTGHGRGALAVADGEIWVANAVSQSLARLDRDTLTITAMLRLRQLPVAAAFDGSLVWVVCRNGWLWKVSPAEPSAEGVARLGRRTRCLATSGAAVWALRDSGELIQVEPNTGGIALQCRAGRGARQLAVGADAIWVVTARGRNLVCVDPTSGQIQTQIALPGRAVDLALDQETAWAACRQRRHTGNGALTAVDRITGELRESVALSGQPRAIAIGAGAIWVGCSHQWAKHRGTIQRFHPPTGKATLAISSSPWPVDRLAVSGRSLLATMRVGGSDAGRAETGVFGGETLGDLGGLGDGGGGGNGGGGG